MSRWVLEKDRSGSFAVSCGGRGRKVDLSQEAAEDYVRENMSPGDKVYLQDPEDGYLTVHRLPKARQRVKARRR